MLLVGSTSSLSCRWRGDRGNFLLTVLSSSVGIDNYVPQPFCSNGSASGGRTVNTVSLKCLSSLKILLEIDY